MEQHADEFTISTDKQKIDVEFVHGFLSRSYWAQDIPVETVRKSIAGSLCFGVYAREQQVGFARVITDGATFAYLADVFIDEDWQGRGLSRLLMEVIMAHPDLQGLRRFLLATRDAHGLYRKFGFEPLSSPDPWMQVHRPDIYQG